jgi:hypothetical protein
LEGGDTKWQKEKKLKKQRKLRKEDNYFLNKVFFFGLVLNQI